MGISTVTTSTLLHMHSCSRSSPKKVFDGERLAKMFASLRIAGYLASSPSSAAEEIGVRIVAGVHIAFSGMRHSSAAAAVRGGVAAKWSEKGR